MGPARASQKKHGLAITAGFCGEEVVRACPAKKPFIIILFWVKQSLNCENHVIAFSHAVIARLVDRSS
jgi:hypothetical protein